jgi:cytidyltransferase-like protein
MILTSGAFDGLHAGHVRYLNAAKALCADNEVLVCAVAPDAYIEHAKLRKPYWPQRDRMTTLEALESVDAVIPQQSTSASLVIRQLRPRIFVKGPDWDGKLPEAILMACEEVGTQIVFVDTNGIHVSDARR